MPRARQGNLTSSLLTYIFMSFVVACITVGFVVGCITLVMLATQVAGKTTIFRVSWPVAVGSIGFGIAAVTGVRTIAIKLRLVERRVNFIETRLLDEERDDGLRAEAREKRLKKKG